MKAIRRGCYKIYQKICSVFTIKNITVLAVIGFVVLMIPILDLADVNRATGDDYGYSYATRQAWIATHSIWEVVKTACSRIEGVYNSWQGTWFSIFLFAFQPEIFHEDAYIIVPYMNMAIWIGSTFYLFREVFVKQLKVEKWSYCLFAIVFLVGSIEFIPSTKSAIFWYNGAAHYMIPFAMCQVLLAFVIKYITEYKKRYLPGIVLFMTLLGGSNYQAALFSLLTTLLIGIYSFWVQRDKRVFVLGVPIITLSIGLVISMKAPGNANRGGEEFGFSIEKIFCTIAQSFVQGGKEIIQYFVEKPLLFAVVLFLFALSMWMLAQLNMLGKIKHRFLIGFLLFCVYCAMQAPAIYAGVEVSGGVYNMNYQVCLLMLTGILILVSDKLVEQFGWSVERVQSYIFVPAVFVCMIIVLGVRGTFKDSTTWVCYDYSRIGRDDIYEEQLNYWRSLLLDDNVKELILPSINDDQGPLMFMPVINDPNAWTNTVTGNYYGKDYIIAIPRDEWIEKYGEPVIGEVPY